MTYLHDYILRASDDDVKTDLELIHETCGTHLCDAEHDDELGVLVSVAEDHEAVCTGPARYQARIVAQAWVNDYAVEIDAEGPTTWDATEGVAGMPDDYRAALIDELRDAQDGEVLDRDDWLKDDPNAPEWVRDHRGPFDIYIRPAAICRWCGTPVKDSPGAQYGVEGVDGSLCCDVWVEGCPACEDGESHPHEAVTD